MRKVTVAEPVLLNRKKPSIWNNQVFPLEYDREGEQDIEALTQQAGMYAEVLNGYYRVSGSMRLYQGARQKWRQFAPATDQAHVDQAMHAIHYCICITIRPKPNVPVNTADAENRILVSQRTECGERRSH